MATGKSNKILLVIVVIAVIVIILAVAIPAYQTSQTHKHLNAALDEAAAAKLVVAEAAMVHGGDPAGLAASDIHWNNEDTRSQYVASIRVLDGGRIRVATRDTGADADPVLLLTPTHPQGSVAIDWQCRVIGGSTSTFADGCSAVAASTTTPAPGASAPAASSSVGKQP